jgi:uncharacterized tellurite resistance protein B-like protein
MLFMFETLSHDDRMLLLKFVCAFAWTDLQIQDGERRFVRRLVERLGLSGDDARQVDEWLDIAPAPHSVDPKRIPSQHRQTFIEAVRAMMYSDGNVDAEEREQLEKLKAALGG